MCVRCHLIEFCVTILMYIQIRVAVVIYKRTRQSTKLEGFKSNRCTCLHASLCICAGAHQCGGSIRSIRLPGRMLIGMLYT